MISDSDPYMSAASGAALPSTPWISFNMSGYICIYFLFLCRFSGRAQKRLIVGKSAVMGHRRDEQIMTHSEFRRHHPLGGQSHGLLPPFGIFNTFNRSVIACNPVNLLGKVNGLSILYPFLPSIEGLKIAKKLVSSFCTMMISTDCS